MINFTIGPVQMDVETQKIGAQQIPYFRTPEFSAVMKENESLLCRIRPVVTFRTIAKDIYWENITDENDLVTACRKALTDTESIAKRRWIVDNYDPHLDGRCCERMLAEAEDYIRRHGVPEKRKLNLWRKYTSIKAFGRIKK